MNKVIVRINGFEYTLKGEEKEEYLHKIASYVDKKIKNISDTNSMLSTTDSAVLTAVNTVDEMMKINEAYEKQKAYAEELQEKETGYNEQIENLKKQLKNMEMYNEELKEKLKHSKNEEYIKEKEENIAQLNAEIENLKQAIQEQSGIEKELRNENKELKFQNQSTKYKIIDLQNKLIDSQIEIAKLRKLNKLEENPLKNRK